MFIILIGTKAQLIKMAPVIKEMDERKIPFKFVLTGQHTLTMAEIIESFQIRQPDDTLVDSGESDTSFKLVKWLIAASISIRKKDYFNSQIKMILVHGDTLSTIFGALVGKIYKIPVVHIEAGLRSFNYLNPFPEELIRVLVSKITTIHFCPGQWACDNLKDTKGEIIDTHTNTLYDSLIFATNKLNRDDDKKIIFAIVSMHRNENLSSKKRLNILMNTLIKISGSITIKFILHPVTKRKLISTGWLKILRELKNIELIERMNYVDFIHLLSNARFLLTDGGSNQEEAAYMGIPCLLLRSHTERTEGLSTNVIISHYDPDVIQRFVSEHLRRSNNIKPEYRESPSQLIVNYLAKNSG